MRVTEVHFNHNPASHAGDALTIRYGMGGAVIAAPEWRDGVSHPVAYTAQTLRNSFTVKAAFFGGPPNGTMEIRAVATEIGRERTLLPLGAVADPLGGMLPKVVAFGATGKSGLETFVIKPGPSDDLVGAHDLVWDWQLFHAGEWRSFGTTRHRIFVLAGHPTPPWAIRASEVENLEWPWVEALELACAWANGADTVELATERIVNVIHSLPNQVYNTASAFSDSTDDPFNLTSFMEEVKKASFNNDCRGTAGAVVTFANLLGASLCRLQVFNDLITFNTRSVRLIGPAPPPNFGWGFREWSFHELVTVQGVAVDEQLPVYDACLRLEDSPDNPVVRRPLGHVDPGGLDYLFKLIASGEDVENRVVRAPRPLI